MAAHGREQLVAQRDLERGDVRVAVGAQLELGSPSPGPISPDSKPVREATASPPTPAAPAAIARSSARRRVGSGGTGPG